jgi:alkylation response protein AidB-like acyl-CoA dehydrogenase
MKLAFSAGEERFREEIADWLSDNLRDGFEALRYRGGPGDEHMFLEERKAWERRMAEGGWVGIGWPEAHGGRGCSIAEQVIFHEEYARAGGPGRMGHIGEGLTAPTLIACGSPEQQARYLPAIREGREFWCQGYSEPGAGSDLGNVRSRARLEDGAWKITGQKVWTSLAHESDWCFVIARTDPQSAGNRGLGFFLIAMDQPGVEVRPIVQITGTSEFNEVFFENAVAADIVGKPGEGWTIAMALLGFERGVSTLGQQMLFQNELDAIVAIARRNGAAADANLRQRIAEAHIGLRTMRYNAMRMLSGGRDGSLQREALVYKLHWASWHRDLGELAMDVVGPDAELLGDDGDYDLSRLQSLFLFSRSDTIYGGTNQIQRNIIAERGLGMPREPRPK